MQSGRERRRDCLLFGTMVFREARRTSLVSLALSPFCATSKQKNTAEAVFLPRRSVTVRARRSGLLLARFFFDVFHYIADRLQLLRIFIRHFDGKFLFKRHH